MGYSDLTLFKIKVWYSFAGTRTEGRHGKEQILTEKSWNYGYWNTLQTIIYYNLLFLDTEEDTCQNEGK